MADLTQKRQNIAKAMIVEATQFLDSLNALKELKLEKTKLGTDVFLDADFNVDGLKHLSAGIVNVFFDDCVTSVDANMTDTANGGRNIQNFVAVRK